MRVLYTLLITALTITVTLAQSVLSSGEWHKISISKSGIYKIDRSYLASVLDINLSNFDPRTLKLYGSPINGMLPQENSIARPNDPVEFAVLGVGTQDGSMDQGDYFLFCGFAPDHFSVDTTWHYQKNLYTEFTSYFLTYGGENGKRLETTPAENEGDLTTTFTDYIIHETDAINKFRSGRLWFGEDISGRTGSQQSFSYDATGALGSLNVTIAAIGACADGCDYEVSLNDQLIGQLPVEPILTGAGNTYQDKAKYADTTFTTTLNGSSINLKLKFNKTGNATGHLDYFVIGYERMLAVYGDQTFIHTGNTADQKTYEVANSSAQTQIWEVTDRANAKIISHTLAGSKARFNLNSTSGRSLVAFNGSNFPNPEYRNTISNQNIKSLVNAEGIIITHPDFLSEANRLAQFHQSEDQLAVGVVTTRQVYNEFSSGMQDITAIRDFLKYAYETGGTLKYALFFGDGSYDYKDRLSNNTNFVPVYESRESFHPIYSHSSDDYFGFFDENEGEWSEGVRKKNSTTYLVPYEDHTLEIGIGRIPAKSSEEAAAVVNKIIRYKTSDKALGKWRNEIAYFSDDGDNATHMIHADQLFEIVDTLYEDYNAKKLYLDNFDQPNNKSPKATEAILNAIKDGVFIFNYIGHGNEEQLTIENVINSTVISKLTNRQKLPLFVTATCDFAKYDDPIRVSGGEQLLLSPNGGAIGMVCTTRPVFAHTNFPVNQAFHESVLKKVNGKYPRLGDVIKATKNNSLRGPVNRNFALLGDPMLRLNYPEYSITFDQMSSTQDTLSALENYQLSGQIQADDALVQSFNGKGILTLWDIPQEKVTKGTGNAPYYYQDQTNALFRGEVTVRDGTFTISFVLPKNISYKYHPGKLTMYAWNESELIDASGATRNFVLGGTAPETVADQKPPTGNIYLNEPSFVSGGTVGTSSLFIAKLSDESGINISNNGFNNSITLTLNDEEPLVLNDFYTASTNDYTKGTVLFALQNLEPGSYSAELKFWDTYNNSATSRVEFKVSDKPIIRIYNANLFPNPVPVDGEATFRFEHDREGEELEINISLYSMKGEQVHRSNFTIDNSPGTIDDLRWTVGNLQGTSLEKGVYLYRLSVTSTLDGANNEVIKRLIIIN